MITMGVLIFVSSMLCNVGMLNHMIFEKRYMTELCLIFAGIFLLTAIVVPFIHDSPKDSIVLLYLDNHELKVVYEDKSYKFSPRLSESAIQGVKNRLMNGVDGLYLTVEVSDTSCNGLFKVSPKFSGKITGVPEGAI